MRYISEFTDINNFILIKVISLNKRFKTYNYEIELIVNVFN